MSGLKPPTYKYTANPQVGSFSADFYSLRRRPHVGAEAADLQIHVQPVGRQLQLRHSLLRHKPVSGLKPPTYKYTANP